MIAPLRWGTMLWWFAPLSDGDVSVLRQVVETAVIAGFGAVFLAVSVTVWRRWRDR